MLKHAMLRMLLNWLLSAVALFIVAKLVPGFHVNGFGAALWAALVIGFVNATLGIFLKIITLPLTVITIGLFWWIINAFMLELATAFTPNFRIDGFFWAFVGAIVLALLQMILRWLVMPREE
jgi:putative membrane protein